MGPRPLGRGWEMYAELQRAGQLASMGPRPLGRGWLPDVIMGAEAHDSFNGAATARSRMGGAGVTSRPASAGFNGAATARSRMGRAG